MEQKLKLSAGIYMIKNTMNNKVYIGSSTNTTQRLGRHKRGLRKNIHDNKSLQKDWNKMGGENFGYEILRTAKYTENLKCLEDIYLDLYESYKPENGYNISKRSSNVPQKMTQSETNKIIDLYQKTHSVKHVGKQTHHDDRTIKKILIENRIQIIPTHTNSEQRRKISLNNAAKRPEVKEKLRISSLRQAKDGKIKMDQLHTKEAIQRMKETKKINNILKYYNKIMSKQFKIEKTKIINLYNNGISPREISKIIHRERATIYKILYNTY
jgi:group I intron endonuclease